MSTKKNIKTPEELESHFDAYKKEAKATPRIENCYTARTNTFCPVPREKPLTMAGFEIYLRKNKILCKLDDYISNKDNRYKDYAAILHAIKLEMYEDKYTGAAAGIFNQNIIARDLGLADKKEIKAEVEQPLFPEDDDKGK